MTTVPRSSYGAISHWYTGTIADNAPIPNPEIIDRELLANALTHRSIKIDVAEKIPDNERLEYLGDAVLDFLVVRCVFVEHYSQVKPSNKLFRYISWY